MRRRVLFLATIVAIAVSTLSLASAHPVPETCGVRQSYGQACVTALNYASLSGEFPSISCHKTKDGRPACYGLATIGADGWVSAPKGGHLTADSVARSGEVRTFTLGQRSVPAWFSTETYKFAPARAIAGNEATHRWQYATTTALHITPEVVGSGRCLTYKAEWRVLAQASANRPHVSNTPLASHDVPSLARSEHTHTLQRTYCV